MTEDELDRGQPPTREQLMRIFGAAEIWREMTTHDETARTLVREALDLFTNPETTIDLRDWVKAAVSIVGPIEQKATT